MTSDDLVADLVEVAFRKRTTANSGPGWLALSWAAAQMDGLSDEWRARLLAEQAHYASVMNIAGVNARALAIGARQTAERTGDAVLVGLALRELSRIDSGAASASELASAAQRLAAELPGDKRWAVSPAQVHGMLVTRASRIFHQDGQCDESLRVLEEGRRTPHVSVHWVCQMYRWSLTELRHLYRDAECEVLLDELALRFDELGDEGRATHARMAASIADHVTQWRRSLELRQRAFPLLKGLMSRASVANDIAYALIKARDEAGALMWLDTADALWKKRSDPSTAQSGYIRALRLRAVYRCVLRGQWRAGLSDLTAMISMYRDKKLGVTWATLIELLDEFLATGGELDDLAGVSVAYGDTVVSLRDMVSLLEAALDASQEEGRLTLARCRIAAVRATARGAVDELPGLVDGLNESIAYLESTAHWWRAGRARLAYARLRESSDPQSAAEAAAAGVADWVSLRNEAQRADDESWLSGSERDELLFAWRLAVAAKRPDLAEVVAECARGTAVAALLRADSTVGPVVNELGRAIEELARLSDESVTDGDSETSHESDGRDDGSDGGEVQVKRAAGRQLAKARIDTLEAKLGGLLAFAPAVGALRLSDPVGSDWFAWIEVTETEVLVALRTPLGQFSSVHTLSESSSQTLLSLADPQRSTKLIHGSPRNLDGLLREIGTALLAGVPCGHLESSAAHTAVQLHICPGGLGWAIPWSAVQVDGVPLIDRAVVMLVSSYAGAAELHSRMPAPRKGPVAVFEETLEGAKIERDALRELWPTTTELDYPAERDHPVPPLDLSDHRLLAASVHGELGAGGLEQALFFPSGVVKAHSMLSWRFPPLVVFSACWVGRADVTRTGDPVGTFLPALVGGAQCFIGGQFAIHDAATGSIMRHFYRLVRDGVDSAHALREAQLAYRQENPAAPLAAWAGLVAIGSFG